ncbi:MAG: 6-bladed beta-propeller [Bacteroidales bacterium]|nr:6-bladed beta-propeller [Bacteroidales bacterium]
MKRIILLSFLLIGMSYCKVTNPDKADDGDSVLEIDLFSESKPAGGKLSSFADDIEFIPLQTTRESLIGGPARRVVSREQRIYVSDATRIMCFDIEGRFLYKLDKLGRGPGEYSVIFYFDVDPDNKYLVIPNHYKLLFYGISDTGFYFQRSLAFHEDVLYVSEIVPGTNHVFIPIPPWRGNEQTLSLLIDNFGDTVHFKPNGYKYTKQSKGGSRGLGEMQVYSIDKKVCFRERFSDTVFYVDTKDNHFKPRMILNSHNTVVTPEIRGGAEASGRDWTYVNKIFETSRYVFFSCRIWDGKDRSNNNRIIFDKTTNIKYMLDIDSEYNSPLVDDLGGGPAFNMSYLDYSFNGDILFSFVEAHALKKHVASEEFKNAKVKYPEKKERIKELSDSLDDMDNPVLVMVRLKR